MPGPVKARLDQKGCLLVLRRGEWTPQMCFSGMDAEGRRSPCGDWCPQFDTGYVSPGKTEITLCQGHRMPVEIETTTLIKEIGNGKIGS